MAFYLREIFLSFINYSVGKEGRRMRLEQKNERSGKIIKIIIN